MGPRCLAHTRRTVPPTPLARLSLFLQGQPGHVFILCPLCSPQLSARNGPQGGLCPEALVHAVRPVLDADPCGVLTAPWEMG